MEMKFVKTLVESIVKNKDMPKVQVEREISPIIEIFIEGFMDELAKNNKIDEGAYKLIAPEFPLSNKDDNHRSKNIDFLVLNKDTNVLYFVELKTDSSSFKLEQYTYYKDIINNKSTTELYEFLESLKNVKYKDFKENIIDENITKSDFQNIKKMKLIYLAPKKILTRQWGSKNKSAIDNMLKKDTSVSFISFEDLNQFNNINHEFNDVWKIITSILVGLDNN